MGMLTRAACRAAERVQTATAQGWQQAHDLTAEGMKRLAGGPLAVCPSLYTSPQPSSLLSFIPPALGPWTSPSAINFWSALAINSMQDETFHMPLYGCVLHIGKAPCRVCNIIMAIRLPWIRAGLKRWTAAALEFERPIHS